MTPQPVCAATATASSPPGGGFTYRSATSAIRNERASGFTGPPWPTRARHADRGGDSLGQPLTVPAVGRRVKLLPHGPEPVQAGEGEFRAWHLLDPPALVPQRVDHRGVDPGTVRSVANFGVLIQQAMCHKRHTHEPSIRWPATPGRPPPPRALPGSPYE